MNKEEILNQIKVVFEQINIDGKAQNSAGLLTGANKLATLRYNLSPLWINAKEEADRIEADYKDKVAHRMLELRQEKKTIEESKAQARIECSPDYLAYLQADKERLTLQTLRDDLAMKVSLIQSICSELRTQRNTGEIRD